MTQPVPNVLLGTFGMEEVAQRVLLVVPGASIAHHLPVLAV